MKLFYDSKSAINIAYNHVQHDRKKTYWDSLTLYQGKTGSWIDNDWALSSWCFHKRVANRMSTSTYITTSWKLEYHFIGLRGSLVNNNYFIIISGLCNRPVNKAL